MTHRRYGTRPPDHHPALAAIARDDHPFIVVQKSAQVGLTELAVNQALWAADTGYAERGNMLFLMPTQNQMDDFAQARFDRAIQDSAYLRGRLQPEPPRRKGADSKRLKRVGPGYIFLRGADSRRQVASVDADLVVLDEFDQMAEGVLELATKRIASSAAGRILIASTPRLPEAGVNGLFIQSNRRRYFIPCPRCGLEQALSWDENVDVERAVVVCRSCGEPMDVLAPGRWIATAPGNDRIRGYHLSRLYSPWANIPQMIEASEATGLVATQEFQNSDLGEVFSPPGGGVSLDALDRCRADYSLGDYRRQRCVMGIDVGKLFHVVIRDKDPIPRLWYAGEVKEVRELHRLMNDFNVGYTVIDAQPEMRLAAEFARAHPRRVWLAQYGRQQPGYQRDRDSDPAVIHINRTEFLDATFARFRERRVELPRDARQLGGRVKQGVGEYYRELRALQRSLERDVQGNVVSRWRDRNKDDHYAHAELYCLLAGEVGPVQEPGFVI